MKLALITDVEEQIFELGMLDLIIQYIICPAGTCTSFSSLLPDLDKTWIEAFRAIAICTVVGQFFVLELQPFQGKYSILYIIYRISSVLCLLCALMQKYSRYVFHLESLGGYRDF